MSKPDDDCAPGEGAADIDFGGPTVRTPVPASVAVGVISGIQGDITSRHAKVGLGADKLSAVPTDDADAGSTVPNSGPAALPPPPVVAGLPAGGVLGSLGDDNPLGPLGSWSGKVQSFLHPDFQNTTPLPKVVVANMATTQVAAALPSQVQMPTLGMKADQGQVPSYIVDLATMPSAQDNDVWVRLALALKRCFDAHGEGAVDVIATALNPSSDSGPEFRRDSLVVCVLDWKKYKVLCAAESDITRSRQIPADFKRALLLIWADMKLLPLVPARCLRVRGEIGGDIICEVEQGSVTIDPVVSSSLRWLLIVLVALGLVGAGVLAVMGLS